MQLFNLVVHIGDLELSDARFALRVIGGLILGGIVLFLFYYVPANLTTLASPYVPAQYLPYLNDFVSALVSPGIPFLGVLLAIITFVDILFKGSWIYGIVLIVTGVLFLSYDILLFRGGQLVSDYPSYVTQSPIYQQLTPVLNAILIILIIMTLFSIGRGISLVLGRNNKKKRMTT